MEHARELFELIKREGNLPGARVVAVDPGRVGQFYVDEFMQEFMACQAFDPEGTGCIELDATVTIRYQGNTLAGGHIETHADNGLWYHECGGRGELRVVGIGADRNGNVTHAAVFQGDLERQTYTLELLGEGFCMRRDEAFSNLRQLL